MEHVITLDENTTYIGKGQSGLFRLQRWKNKGYFANEGFDTNDYNKRGKHLMRMYKNSQVIKNFKYVGTAPIKTHSWSQATSSPNSTSKPEVLGSALIQKKIYPNFQASRVQNFIGWTNGGYIYGPPESYSAASSSNTSAPYYPAQPSNSQTHSIWTGGNCTTTDNDYNIGSLCVKISNIYSDRTRTLQYETYGESLASNWETQTEYTNEILQRDARIIYNSFTHNPGVIVPHFEPSGWGVLDISGIVIKHKSYKYRTISAITGNFINLASATNEKGWNLNYWHWHWIRSLMCRFHSIVIDSTDKVEHACYSGNTITRSLFSTADEYTRPNIDVNKLYHSPLFGMYHMRGYTEGRNYNSIAANSNANYMGGQWAGGEWDVLPDGSNHKWGSGINPVYDGGSLYQYQRWWMTRVADVLIKAPLDLSNNTGWVKAFDSGPSSSSYLSVVQYNSGITREKLVFNTDLPNDIDNYPVPRPSTGTGGWFVSNKAFGLGAGLNVDDIEEFYNGGGSINGQNIRLIGGEIQIHNLDYGLIMVVQLLNNTH